MSLGMGSQSQSKHQGAGRSKRAGLVFPVGRIHRFLKNGNYAQRIGNGAPVYAAAVIEYLVAEILELAGNAARDNKKRRIAPRHLMLAIRNDEELNRLVGNAIISQGGVIPNIQPVLMKKATSGGPSEKATGSSQLQSLSQTLKESQMSNLAAKKRPATVSKKSPTAKKPQVNKTNPAAGSLAAPRQQQGSEEEESESESEGEQEENQEAEQSNNETRGNVEDNTQNGTQVDDTIQAGSSKEEAEESPVRPPPKRTTSKQPPQPKPRSKPAAGKGKAFAKAAASAQSQEA